MSKPFSYFIASKIGFFSILSLFLFNACTPKIAPPLQAIQELQYTNSWKKLQSYPISNGRTDDLHFFDPQTGFVINSNGYLVFTADGGKSWEIRHENRGTFFRCLTFKNSRDGWLGTIGTDDPYLYSKDTIPLYETRDSGKTWQPVPFIGPTPKGLCGLQKVTDQFIVGCGRVRGPSFFIKTNDGGESWYSYDLNHLAGSLIAPYFFDESHGFLIGGTTNDKENSHSLVLETFDGGTTWDTAYISRQKGEYCWKFSFPTRDTGFISIQRNVRNGRFYHLETTDGGKTWTEKEHSSGYYYVQGIGFINTQMGWIGGSIDWTYETRDGGRNWTKVGDIGRGFNNFTFFEDSLAYGVGYGVFKSTDLYTSLNQTVYDYYEDGSVKTATNFKNGRKSGKASTYSPNGSIASAGTYKENLKQGSWKYFDKKGQLINKVKMKNGLAKVSKKQIQAYLGNYRTADGTIRKIFLENGQLYSKRGSGRKLAMYPETTTRFFYEFNTEVTIEFFIDSNGIVTHSESWQNGRRTKAIKLSD